MGIVSASSKKLNIKKISEKSMCEKSKAEGILVAMNTLTWTMKISESRSNKKKKLGYCKTCITVLPLSLISYGNIR